MRQGGDFRLQIAYLSSASFSPKHVWLYCLHCLRLITLLLDPEAAVAISKRTEMAAAKVPPEIIVTVVSPPQLRRSLNIPGRFPDFRRPSAAADAAIADSCPI